MMEYRGYIGKVEVDGEEFYGMVVNLHRVTMWTSAARR